MNVIEAKSPSAIVTTMICNDEWSVKYPKSEYNEPSERAKDCALHFLLALKQSDNVILPYISRIKNASLLTASDASQEGLRPLTIATMLGRVRVVEAILERWKKEKTLRTNIDLKDVYGWTALHHASLSSAEIFEMLKRYGADINARTNKGGTASDLMALTQRNIRPIGMDRVRFKDSCNELHPLTTIDINKYLGLEEYRDPPYYPPQEAKHLWRSDNVTEECEGVTDRFILKAYQEWKKSPPSLIIGINSDLQKMTDHCHELVAGESLPCGTVIGEYGGEMRTDHKTPKGFRDSFSSVFKDQIYSNPPFNPAKIGNATRMANWGWPNAKTLSIFIDGSLRILMLAADPNGIKEGEPIYWVYNISDCKMAFGRMKLFGRDKMREFFKRGLDPVLGSFCKGIRRARNEIELYRIECEIQLEADRIMFPLNTPGALLDLHFSGIVPAQSWEPYLYSLKNHAVISAWLEALSSESWIVKSMIKRINELDKALEKREEIKKSFSQWVVANIENFTIMQMLKSFDIAQDVLKTSPNLETFQNILSVRLPEILAEYDWLQDEEAPLGYKRTLQDLIDYFSNFSQSETLMAIHNTLKLLEKLEGHKESEEYRKMLALWDHFCPDKKDEIHNHSQVD